MQNLCGLRVYIKFIFWGPQQQWFQKSHMATGLLNIRVCSSISSLKKNATRDNETRICLCFHRNLSMSLFSSRLTEVWICPFVYVHLISVSQSVCYSHHLFMICGWRVYPKKKKKNQSQFDWYSQPEWHEDKSFPGFGHSWLQQSTILTAYCLQASTCSVTEHRILASPRTRISCLTIWLY